MRYFSRRDASYTCPVIFETTAFSGACPEIAQNIVRHGKQGQGGALLVLDLVY